MAKKLRLLPAYTRAAITMRRNRLFIGTALALAMSSVCIAAVALNSGGRNSVSPERLNGALRSSERLAGIPQANCPNLQAGQKCVRVEITVRDSAGPIPYTNVNVTSRLDPINKGLFNSNPTYKGYTDSNGIAVVQVETHGEPATGKPRLFLSISATKDYYFDGQDEVNYPVDVPDEVTRTITLKKKPTQRVRLTVNVRDSDGKPVGNAKVNVWNNRPGALSGTPDYQADTTPQGVASLDVDTEGDFSNGAVQSLNQSIRVIMTDYEVGTDQVSVSGNVPAEVIRTVTLRKNTTLLSEMTLQIHVVTQGGQDVPGAHVDVWANTSPIRQNYSGQTGADGSAQISVKPFDDFTITVSKVGFPDKKVFWQIPSSIPIGVYEGKPLPKVAGPFTIQLDKQLGTIVTVSVKDLDNQGQGVADAKVVFAGASNPSRGQAITDVSGIATLVVPEPGTYTVQISQNTYEPLSGEQVEVEAQDSQTFEFLMRSKEQAGPDTIQVTVLKRDPTDDIGPPVPAEGVVVRVGGHSMGTNSGGQAVFTGVFNDFEVVSVEASGFASQSKNVNISRRARYDAGKGSATFTLAPDLSDNSPLVLIVEVRGPDGKPVIGANIAFFAAGREIPSGPTDGIGHVTLLSVDSGIPASELRRGLTVSVKSDGFMPIENSSIPSQLLKPSLDPARYLVQLDRDWSELSKAVVNLEGSVTAWRNDVASQFSQGMTNEFIDKALTARKKAEALLAEIQGGREIFGMELGPVISSSTKIAALQQDIQASDSASSRIVDDLKNALNDATNSAAKCSTQADADSISSNYKKAIQLLAQIGTLSKQAVKDRDDLLPYAQQALARKDLLVEMRNKVEEIQSEAASAQENADSATAYYAHMADVKNSLLSRQLTLKAQLAILQVKYDTAVSGIPPDEKSPEIRSLKQRMDTMAGLLNLNDAINFSPPVLPEAAQSLPQSVTDAITAIGSANFDAEKQVEQYEAVATATPTVDTMDEIVDGIDTKLTNESFDIGLAADLPKQAEDCAKKAGTTTADAPTVETIPEDQPVTGTKTNDPPANSPLANQPPKVETIPEDKPGAPSVPGQNIGTTLGGVVGTVQPPLTVEPIPEDNPQTAAKNAAPAPASSPKDPNGPSGLDKVSTVLGSILNAMNNSGNNGANNGTNNGASQPRGGTPNRSGGNKNPTPQGGGTAPKPETIDFSGTWEIANIAPADVPCKVWVRMVIQSAGEGTWSGPESIGNNCIATDMAGQLVVKMFQGMQGTVTVVTTYPGKLKWTLKTLTGQSNQANGSYTKTEIDLSVNGETLKFVKK